MVGLHVGKQQVKQSRGGVHSYAGGISMGTGGKRALWLVLETGFDARFTLRDGSGVRMVAYSKAPAHWTT